MSLARGFSTPREIERYTRLIDAFETMRVAGASFFAFASELKKAADRDVGQLRPDVIDAAKETAAGISR